MSCYVTLDTYFSHYCDCRRGFWVLWDRRWCGRYCQDPVLYIYHFVFGLLYFGTAEHLVAPAEYIERTLVVTKTDNRLAVMVCFY
jgi:hypothetical protein